MDKKKISLTFRLLEQKWPNVKCELIHNTPFQLLLAVMLSAQTTDKSVNKVMEPILDKKKDFGPNDLKKLKEEGFYPLIKTIGLAKTKAKNAVLMANIILDRFQGNVPRKDEELQSLPGVGIKTSHVVLNILYGDPLIGVDTHVYRVSQRLGWVPMSASRDQAHDVLVKILPKKYAAKANILMVNHGRYVCMARNPQCGDCVLSKVCSKEGLT